MPKNDSPIPPDTLRRIHELAERFCEAFDAILSPVTTFHDKGVAMEAADRLIEELDAAPCDDRNAKVGPVTRDGDGRSWRRYTPPPDTPYTTLLTALQRMRIAMVTLRPCLPPENGLTLANVRLMEGHLEVVRDTARVVSRFIVNKPPRRKPGVWLAEAMILVQKNPGLSNNKIAEQVGISASSLCRHPTYKKAAAIARGNAPPVRGHKRADGSVEASDALPGCDRRRGRT